jgi:V/A-type H+-transporting ATPase subunit I
VLGVILLVVPGGALGLMMGPLELVGTLGNVLSYLRLAAVGLASAYLAVVANQLGSLGPIWMGVLIAALFHALNLALAGFSPMIQALRLHYVEFFSKFYEGGGEPFRPFGERGAA